MAKRRFVDTPSPVEEWQTLHREADRVYPALRALWLAVFAEVRDVVTQAAVREALATGDLLKVQAVLTRVWPQVGAVSARSGLFSLLQDAVTRAATVSVPALEDTLGVSIAIRFNVVNEAAVQWISQYAGAEIQGIGQTTMEAIRAIMRRQFIEGRSLTDVMADLQGQVGLTARQAQAVDTLRQRLVDAEVAPAEVARQVDAAAARALRWRVENLARTESITAASAGQQILWETAEKQGFLDASRFKRFWILTNDSRLCPTCRAIPGLNPDGVGLYEPFVTPIGPIDFPAAHPSCRCAVSLREVPQ